MKNSSEICLNKNWQAETLPLLEEIRRLIRFSGMSQRAVEQAAGFSKGYLSQLLGRNLDIKVRHVLAILDALDTPPARFFAQVYGGLEPPLAASDKPDSLYRFERLARPLPDEIDRRLDFLYRGHEETLDRLRRRLRRCEDALDRLADQGLLPAECQSEAKADAES